MYPQFLQIYSVQGGLFMQFNIIFRFYGQAGQKAADRGFGRNNAAISIYHCDAKVIE